MVGVGCSSDAQYSDNLKIYSDHADDEQDNELPSQEEVARQRPKEAEEQCPEEKDDDEQHP
jgi:hypothetical protein